MPSKLLPLTRQDLVGGRNDTALLALTEHCGEVDVREAAALYQVLQYGMTGEVR